MKVSNACVPLLLLLACAASTDPKESASAKADRQERLQRTRSQLAQQQWDEALLQTDELLRTDPNDRDALLLAAEGNLGLAATATKNVDALLEDATRCLRRAIELAPDDVDARMQLADTLLKRGQFADGRDEALAAAQAAKQKGAGEATLCAALLVAAENEMQIFVAARNAEIHAGGKIEAGTRQLAETVLSRVERAKAGQPGPAYLKAAQVYQWLNQHQEALLEFERGIERTPVDPGLHAGYLDLHIALGKRVECVTAYKRLLRQHPQSAPLVWYLGKAQQALADDRRGKGQWDEALTTYRDAAQSFVQYLKLQPQHKDATSDTLAILALSQARVLFEQGDLTVSKQKLLESHELSPRVADQDAEGRPVLFDSFGGTYASGLQKIGSALVAPSTPEALREGLAFYEWAVARHPDRFGFMFNNAALTARDLGNAIERKAGADAAEAAKALAEAMPLYEKSYRWYEQAVALTPSDARIVNDCGLMLVYHLKRDYERARQCFDKAIELGEQQLGELPSDADRDLRNNLEEAVGDAWQNIAVMLLQQGKEFAAARPFCDKAVLYYPYQRRQAAQLLREHTRGPARTPAADLVPAVPGAAGPAHGQDKAKQAAFDKLKKDAEAKADDLDAALLVLDAGAKELKGFAPYHHLCGLYNWRFATRSREAGGKASLVDGLYADAINQLKKAVELDGEPVQPRLDLVKLLVEHGDFADANREAASLLAHMRSRGGEAADLTLQAHHARAVAAARVYIEQKQANKEAKAELDGARESFRELDKQGRLDDQALNTWMTLEQWTGQPGVAFDLVLKQLAKHPDSDQALGRLVELTGGENTKRIVAALAARTDPKGLWYLGRVRFEEALALWPDNPKEPKAALAVIEQARNAFAQAKSGTPAYADSCDQWMALCLTAEGYFHLSANDAEKAGTALLAATRLRPDRITAVFNSQWSTKDGLLRVGGKIAGDLAKAENLFRQATAAAKADADFANNHGLFARDYGTVLERSGDQDTAQKMYEASYASYSRAVELDPTNIRLANDKALIALYHLRRETDQARTTLEDAVARGDKLLQTDPPKDKQGRNDLEEAVGDCCQNLGYYFRHYGKDLTKAKEWYEKSLKYYSPSNRGESRGALRQIEQANKRAESQPASAAGKDK